MPEITLPDGSKRFFEEPVTTLEVAESIGSGLAKATIAGKVDNVLIDSHLGFFSKDFSDCEHLER